MRPVALDGGDNSTHLLAPFAGAQTQMRGKHPQQNGAPDFDAHVERAPGLVIVDGEIETLHAADGMAGQHGIAEIRSPPLMQRAFDGSIAGLALDLGQEALVFAVRGNLLKGDDVGIELRQHGDDPPRRISAIGADRRVNVPGRRPEQGTLIRAVSRMSQRGRFNRHGSRARSIPPREREASDAAPGRAPRSRPPRRRATRRSSCSVRESPLPHDRRRA